MADNLIVALDVEHIKKLIATKKVDVSQYCVLSSDDGSDKSIIITKDWNLKRSLITDYHAQEISDWAFNEEYQKNKKHTYFKIIGDVSLINKGY